MSVATDESDRDALIRLAHCLEPGDEGAGARLIRWGPADLLERITAGRSGLPNEDALRLRLLGQHADAVEGAAERAGARIVTRVDREWPTQLAALGPATPLALWVAGVGDLRLLALRSVAVVGARACTGYGEETARSWAAELAAAQWTVVSGAAFGIDAAAHRGALAADGTTIAVVAGGVDVPYPRAHAPLLDAILDSGAIVSESPPGEAVRRHRFLTRNRIIAALGRATVVVEAATRSGAAATARDAAALNRPVLAVPGPVSSPASSGCHRMIQDGDAILAAELADVLAALDLGAAAAGSPSPATTGRAGDRDALAERERLILDAVPGRGSIGLDALIAAAGLSSSQLLAGVGVLTATGWLTQVDDGWRLARR